MVKRLNEFLTSLFDLLNKEKFMFESFKKYFKTKQESFKNQADGVVSSNPGKEYKQEQSGGNENFTPTPSSEAPSYKHEHQCQAHNPRPTLADEMPIDVSDQFKEVDSIPFEKREKDKDSVPPNP